MVRWRKPKLGSINKAGKTRVMVGEEDTHTGEKLFISVIQNLSIAQELCVFHFALCSGKTRGCENKIKRYGLVTLSK